MAFKNDKVAQPAFVRLLSTFSKAEAMPSAAIQFLISPSLVYKLLSLLSLFIIHNYLLLQYVMHAYVAINYKYHCLLFRTMYGLAFL